MMRRKRGFSLIELMIVVAIIAILAAIAVPWWGRYAYRARRGDGQNLLMHIAQAEERYYTDYNSYALSASSLGYTTLPPTSEHGYYTATLAANPASSTGQGYIATAVPVPGGPQANDVCKKLTIDNTGSKSQTGNTSNGDCW